MTVCESSCNDLHFIVVLGTRPKARVLSKHLGVNYLIIQALEYFPVIKNTIKLCIKNSGDRTLLLFSKFLGRL